MNAIEVLAQQQADEILQWKLRMQIYIMPMSVGIETK